MTHRQATASLIAITLIWGFAFTAIKALFRDMSPLLGVGVRFAIAALLLAPLLRGLTRREVVAGLIIGSLFAGGVAFQNVGLDITTPSRSAFIISLSALLTPAVGAALLRHPVPPAVLGRLLGAMAGVYLLTAPGGGLVGLNRGDWLTLVAAVIFAGHIVAVGHYASGGSAARILAVKFAVTSVVGFASALALEPSYLTVTPRMLWLVVFLTASSIVTFGLQLRAQRVVHANEAALIFTFEPVVAAAVSYLTFGERLTLVQMAGGLLIMAAVGWPRRVRLPSMPKIQVPPI